MTETSFIENSYYVITISDIRKNDVNFLAILESFVLLRLEYLRLKKKEIAKDRFNSNYDNINNYFLKFIIFSLKEKYY